MKPVAAFAVGLWTGALVMTAVGGLYFSLWAGAAGKPTVPVQDQLEVQLAGLKQENARIAAEAQRLRETVTDLRSRPVAESVRRLPFRRQTEAPEIEPWILENIQNPDAQSLPKLEQAAVQNNLDALDAVALLADRDNAAALVRVAAAPTLNAAGKQRVALLLGATVELNPQAEELLLALVGSDPLWAPLVVVGLETPRLVTRLGVTPPARVKSDYALRLRIVTSLRAAVTDESLVARLERARTKLTQRAGVAEQP